MKSTIINEKMSQIGFKFWFLLVESKRREPTKQRLRGYLVLLGTFDSLRGLVLGSENLTRSLHGFEWGFGVSLTSYLFHLSLHTTN